MWSFITLSTLTLVRRHILPKWVAFPSYWPRSWEPQSFGVRAHWFPIQSSLEIYLVLLVADVICSIHSIKQNLSLSSLQSYLKKYRNLFYFLWRLFYSLSSPAQHYEKVWCCAVLDSGCIWKYTDIFWAIRINNVAPTLYSLHHRIIFLKNVPRSVKPSREARAVLSAWWGARRELLTVTQTHNRLPVYCQLHECPCNLSLPFVWEVCPLSHQVVSLLLLKSAQNTSGGLLA